MSTSTVPTSSSDSSARSIGALQVVPIPHPQGCRSYVIADPRSRQALALDVHLDSVGAVERVVREHGWTLPYVVDSHTHADHPSGAAAIAVPFGSTRIAHERSGHKGVTRHPADGSTLHLGDEVVTVWHTPGHTPDHLVLVIDGALFAGDTLLIGGVSRTDFLGGDAGELFDSLQRLLAELRDDVVLFPGHDYAGRIASTIGDEKRGNPWLSIGDRAEFVRALTANPPPKPANMDALLELNREGRDVPATISAQDAIQRVARGGAVSMIDVRTDLEVQSEHVAGATHVPLDELERRIDEVRARPAPRLILCRSGARATRAQATLREYGVGATMVVTGGIEAYRAAGGATVEPDASEPVMSLERQVRIAAGALVCVGVLLGIVVHPAFLGLAAFVGAGLVFAGVTDRCGMALLIAKLPWNRKKPSASSSPAGGPVAACSAGPPSAGACAASPPPARK